MPRILKFNSTSSANAGTVIRAAAGVSYEAIKQVQTVRTNVLASVDPASFPSASSQMPPIYRPKAVAWGPTYGQSVLIDTTPDGSATETRRFYSMNTNQVYASDWSYNSLNELSGATRVGAVTIPTYWTALSTSPNFTPTGSVFTAHHRTRQGMSYLSSSSGERLVMPLGDMGDRGLAVLNLTSDFVSSTWHAYEANLRNSFGYIPSPQQSQLVESCVSKKYILVSQYQSGIAFYSTSSYEWLGNLQMPGWQTSNLIVRHAMIREINNRNILSVAVDPQSFSGSTPTNPVPKVLFYDVDAIATADLSQTISTNFTPSNTAVPLAGIFGSGSLSGSSSTDPLLALQSDLNTLPGSEVTLTNDSTLERPLSVVTTKYWAEIYDVTHLVIANTKTSESDNPAAATGSYGELVSGDASYNGLNVTASVPMIKGWLDTFAISTGPSGDCGPPANARARADWGNLLSISTGGTCTLAGSYILIGDGTGNYSYAAGYNLLSIETDDPYLTNFKVNRAGQYTTQLGLTGQFELTPSSNLTFDSLGVSNSGSWIAGTVRGGVGVYAAQLPPEAKLSAINLVLHESASSTNGAGRAWEPTASGNPLGPECDRSYFSASAYRYSTKIQGTSFFYNPAKETAHQLIYSDIYSPRWECTSSTLIFDPAQRSGHYYKSFLVNQNSTLAWNAWYPSQYPSQSAPTHNEFSTHGGFEMMSLDILPDKDLNRSRDVLFGACRSTNSVYAFVASPGGNNQMLDRTDWIRTVQGIAVASSSLPDKSLVAAVGIQNLVEFAYWDESAREFSSSVAASSSFIRYPACYPALPGLDALRAPGFRDCMGVKAPSMVSGSLVTASAVTHIWAPYRMNEVTTINDSGSFEILIVPVSEVESSTPDDQGFIECTASLNRFKRDTSTGTGSVVPVGPNTEPSTVGRLELWGSVQSHKYVLSWANEYNPSTQALTAHYIAVHELTMSQNTGTGPSGDPSFVRNDITSWTNQGEPTADILMAKPIRLIPLTDFHLREDGEGGKVTLSPQEDYLCVGGGSGPGMFLLYMGAPESDLSSSAGYPVPVAGLTKAGAPVGSGSSTNSVWRGWRKTTGSFGGNISDQLSGAVYNDRTAKAPTWPLVDATGTNFPIPAWPPVTGTVAIPGQIYFRSNYMNVCEFKQEGDDLYIYAQTAPWTLWHIDKTAATGYATSGATGNDATEVLELVGAISDEQTQLRARCSVRQGPYIFWAGDIGAWVT